MVTLDDNYEIFQHCESAYSKRDLKSLYKMRLRNYFQYIFLQKNFHTYKIMFEDFKIIKAKVVDIELQQSTQSYRYANNPTVIKARIQNYSKNKI